MLQSFKFLFCVKALSSQYAFSAEFFCELWNLFKYYITYSYWDVGCVILFLTKSILLALWNLSWAFNAAIKFQWYSCFWIIDSERDFSALLRYIMGYGHYVRTKSFWSDACHNRSREPILLYKTTLRLWKIWLDL